MGSLRISGGCFRASFVLSLEWTLLAFVFFHSYASRPRSVAAQTNPAEPALILAVAVSVNFFALTRL